MKALNIVLMILMAALALREVNDMVQHGPDGRNVLFGLLFAAFAVRRFMIMQSGSAAKF